MATGEPNYPLRQLRAASGLKPAEVIALGKEIYDDFPSTSAALCMLEERGTRNIDLIQALALIYRKRLDEMSETCKHQKN